MGNTEKVGAGLFDLRSLPTATLHSINGSLLAMTAAQRHDGESSTRFFATVRRILSERGAL